ncbi:MAG: nuclear transport factor 2 family protein [Bacteroidota bacterium]
MKIILSLCVGLSSVFAQSDSTSLQLAQKEREFSETAAVKGIKSAFLAFFDDNCVSFYPKPVNGKQAMAAEPETPGLLSWSPSFVEVSASEDFGFTTGPSEYRAGGVTDSVAYYAHFVSVWKKNDAGDWHVILDVGSGYPKDEKKEEKFIAKELSFAGTKKPVPVVSGRLEMLAADTAFSDLMQAKGGGPALLRYASEDVMVYRKGLFPVRGKTSGLELVKNEKPLSSSYYAGNVSSAGDLGFTYGIAVGAASDTSTYVRIWRKDQTWEVLVDVLKPWPMTK